jgi:peptidoglycan/LPS O-acetylase OafA/YrhL
MTGLLFFLLSGYIIPASLERRGSLRTFWISRIGRLFPLYLVIGVVVVALGFAGLVPLDPFLPAHPVTAVVAHLTMVPFLLGVPLVTPVIWTLTYEMAFYLLVSALFTVRAQRASGRVSLLLAAVAVLTVPLAPKLLAGFPGLTAVVAVVAAAYLGLVVGIAWLTHRYVEKPGQRLARRVSVRLGS